MAHPSDRWRWLPITIAAWLLSAIAAGAQTGSTLLNDSPVVVHARVATMQPAWDRATGVIVTYVELEVLEDLGGAGVPGRIVLKQLGGEVGGIGLWVADQASFSAGEDALLYLSIRRSDGTLHTTALEQGKLAPTLAALTAARATTAGRGTTAAPAYLAEPAEYAALPRTIAPAFAYLPTDGDPARWHEVDDNVAVFVDHPTAVPGTWTGGAVANATNAVNLWRNSGMELDLRDGGNTYPTGSCAATFTGNGRISVSYNDPCGYVADWVVGGGYYTTGDLRTVNGQRFQKFIQGFAVLDNTGPQTTSAGCFQDAVAHGLGHALGLGHSTSAGAMMQAAPSGSCATAAATLSADDRAGIVSIYSGIASGPFPPNTPTNFTATAALSTVSLAWTPADAGGTAQRYLLDVGTAPGASNLGSVTYPGSTTSVAVAGVPAGTYYLRLRAQNAIGTSAASPERSVTVGACAAPGAPGTLTGTSNAALVNLQWSAPATGLAQGYRFSVGSGPGLSNLSVVDLPASPTALAGLAPYGTYFVRVQATNVCGASVPSNEIMLVVQPCTAAPLAPAGLTIAKSGTFLSISWTAPTGTPATSYTLAVGDAPGLSNLAVLATGTTSTTLAGNAPVGQYHVRVLAQNACGLSGPSNEVFIAVP